MPHEDLPSAAHALLRCRTLDELLSLGRELTGNPLILADLSLHVLAVTRDENISDPRWHEINDSMSLPMNIVNIGLYQSSLHSGAPVQSTDSTGLPIVRCAITEDDRLIGYLLAPCYYGAPGQEQLGLLAMLADLCSLRMQKDLHYAEYPEDMREFFVSDLINGAITDEQKILDRCAFFHWNLKPPYRLLTIAPAGSGAGSGEEYLSLESGRRELQKRFPDATTFLYGNQIKLIIHVPDRTVRDTLLLRDITAWLEENGMRAGAANIGYRLRSLSGRHRQAMKALQMGSLLDGSGPLFMYDTHSVYHCLELASDRIDLLQLCHPAVIALEAYDRENGTELLQTLHGYLAASRNVSTAAEALFIHRNTLSKRLEKINDLIHVDLSDADTVFHLMFSYRVMEYYGATSMRGTYDNWMLRSPGLRHS